MCPPVLRKPGNDIVVTTTVRGATITTAFSSKSQRAKTQLLAESIDYKPQIAKLLKKMNSRSDKVREAALIQMEKIAEKTDISDNIPQILQIVASIADGEEQAAFNSIFVNAAVNGTSSKKTLEALLTALYNPDREIRFCAVFAFEGSVESGVDIAIAMPRLIELLKDEYHYVRWYTASTFKCAIKHGADIRIAVPALADALIGVADIEYREPALEALEALRYAADKGYDISIAVPNLVEALKLDYTGRMLLDFKKQVCNLLMRIAENGDDSAKIAITKGINEIMQSNWFVALANQNNALYLKIVRISAKVMAVIAQKGVGSAIDDIHGR